MTSRSPTRSGTRSSSEDDVLKTAAERNIENVPQSSYKTTVTKPLTIEENTDEMMSILREAIQMQMDSLASLDLDEHSIKTQESMIQAFTTLWEKGGVDYSTAQCCRTDVFGQVETMLQFVINVAEPSFAGTKFAIFDAGSPLFVSPSERARLDGPVWSMLLSRADVTLASLTFSEMASLLMMVDDEHAIELMKKPSFDPNLVDKDWGVDEDDNFYVFPDKVVDVAVESYHEGDAESLLGWAIHYDRPAVVDALLRTPVNVNRRHCYNNGNGSREHLHPALYAAELPECEKTKNSLVCLRSLLAHPDTDISDTNMYSIHPRFMKHFLRHSTMDIHNIVACEWNDKFDGVRIEESSENDATSIKE